MRCTAGPECGGRRPKLAVDATRRLTWPWTAGDRRRRNPRGVVSDWSDDAACRGFPTEWWFPASGDVLAGEVAAAICRRCPVRRECLAEALAVEDDFSRHGILGGLTPQRRAQLAPRRLVEQSAR
jgi:Transcription factor WhiB